MLAVLCGSLCDARAQERDPATAEGSFRAGKEALDAGDLERACALFRQSHAADPAPGTLFYLADCEEKRGRIATAWALFGEVAQRLAQSDNRLETVRARALALEARLPKLTIQLGAGAPAGTTVRRDGTLLAAPVTSTPLPVDPGAHTLLVEAAGHAPRAFEVMLAVGEVRTVQVAPGPPLPPAKHVGPGGDTPHPGEADPRSVPSSSRTQATIGIVVMGAGAAALGASVIVALSARSAYDDSDAHCDDSNHCTAKGVGIREDALGRGDVATALAVAGGVVAVAGAVVWLTAPSRDARTARGSALHIGAGRLALETKF